MTNIIRRTSAAGNLLSHVPALDDINLPVIEQWR